MKIKVGDNVFVLAGKDKGKEGKVLKTFKNDNKVVVEGVNLVKRHTKPSNNNEKGGIFPIEMPIHVSNVKVATGKKAAAKPVKTEDKKVAAKPAAKKETVKKTASKKEGK